MGIGGSENGRAPHVARFALARKARLDTCQMEHHVRCSIDMLQCNKGVRMRDIGKAMARLQAFRRRFEDLLAGAAAKADCSSRSQGQPPTRLRELTAFGANPGNLRMFAYVPGRLPRLAPLVVALHGCSQTAEAYEHGAGWSQLADRLGFAVVYPEQQPANNPQKCFSWFLPGDTTRDQGEALSIQQMVEHGVAEFGIDRRRVFVTGLSAGGAMATAMLATYPEVFAGGAIIAGLPYGCARSVQQALDAMFTEQSQSADTLGDRVRAASKHRGPWPKLSVWHGTADPIVKPSNAEDIVRQWTDVHGLTAAPSYEETIGSYRRRVWADADGEPRIEAFSIDGMAHGVPLESAMGDDNCGAAGALLSRCGNLLHASHCKLLALERQPRRGAARARDHAGAAPSSNRWPCRRCAAAAAGGRSRPDEGSNRCRRRVGRSPDARPQPRDSGRLQSCRSPRSRTCESAGRRDVPCGPWPDHRRGTESRRPDAALTDIVRAGGRSSPAREIVRSFKPCDVPLPRFAPPFAA